MQASGDLLIEQGHYTLVIQPPGQLAMTDGGKFLLLWKRQPDGGWKIYRHMSNSNPAARVPPAAVP